MAVRREVGEPLEAAAEDMIEDVSNGINRSCVWYSKWYLNVGNAHGDWRRYGGVVGPRREDGGPRPGVVILRNSLHGRFCTVCSRSDGAMGAWADPAFCSY